MMKKYKYLLDTSICIELLRGNKQVREHCIEKNEWCCISEIVAIELFRGPYNAPEQYFEKEKSKAQILCDFYESISLDGIAEFFCKEKKRLKNEGITIEDFDLMIGATAVVNGLTLITNNEKHFSRIDSIKIENWTK